VLKQEGASHDCNYITVVEWVSSRRDSEAQEAVAAKHKEFGPHEMFNRRQTKAELDNCVPVAAEVGVPGIHYPQEGFT
jgi:hypothetical protein